MRERTNMEIKTTGELRAFVAVTMSKLRNGEVELEHARLVVKLAGRITDSLYSEAKIHRLAIEAGRQPPALGLQYIGDPPPHQQ